MVMLTVEPRFHSSPICQGRHDPGLRDCMEIVLVLVTERICLPVPCGLVALCARTDSKKTGRWCRYTAQRGNTWFGECMHE
jgi:hypothetical protein